MKKKRIKKRAKKVRLPNKRLLPQLDIDAHLNIHNGSLGQLLILAGLIKGSPAERQRIVEAIEPRWFMIDSFDQFLFVRATLLLATDPNYSFSTGWMITQIKKYYQEIWNTKPNRREFYGELFTCAQILDFSPTMQQIMRAIDLCKEWAELEGLI